MSRVARMGLNQSELPKIDEEFEAITEGEELTRKEKLKTKWTALEALVGNPKRIGSPPYSAPEVEFSSADGGRGEEKERAGKQYGITPSKLRGVRGGGLNPCQHIVSQGR